MSKKLVLDVEDKLWDKVKKFKIDSKVKTLNVAVIKLLKKGLKN